MTTKKITPINKAIEKFEDLKEKTLESGTLRDVIYLDGVLAVLDTMKVYEHEYLNPEIVNKIKYVAGFLFSRDGFEVALIVKNKPEWQKGSMNAIGGKVEEGETSLDAMIREFKEEAGLEIKDWQQFATVSSNEWTVDFFKAYTDNFDDIKSLTDEEVVVVRVPEINSMKVIPNLKWLIPMAILDPQHEICKATVIQ